MSQTQLWPGWETVRVIGSGGFGKVYEIRKAEDSRTGEYRSALKVITIPQSPEDYRAYEDDGYDEKSITAIFRSQIDDIVSEFQMMSQFRGTSNIVSYEDHRIVPHEDGRGWDILIRMELLTSLPQYINQHGLTQKQVIQLGSDICRALELCAQKGIIHRDIKPQNIFVNEFGDFKLGDFGIARTMDHTTKATKTGTYAYMAPEVYSGRPYGASVDIYSLGLVLYWTLNERRLPFLPLSSSAPTAAQNNEAQMKRLSGVAIPPPECGDEALKAAVLKACCFDAASRFSSPEAFSQALDACARNQEYILPPSRPQFSGNNTSRSSQDETDYMTGVRATSYTPSSGWGKQPQGEPTMGGWDTGSSIHWTPDDPWEEGPHPPTDPHPPTTGGNTKEPIQEKSLKRKSFYPYEKVALGSWLGLALAALGTSEGIDNESLRLLGLVMLLLCPFVAVLMSFPMKKEDLKPIGSDLVGAILGFFMFYAFSLALMFPIVIIMSLTGNLQLELLSGVLSAATSIIFGSLFVQMVRHRFLE